MANLESSKEQVLNSKEVNPYIENTQKQIQGLKSSELSSLQWFDNFVSYLEKKALVFKSKKELDSVIAILNAWKQKELREYLDPSNIDWWWYFFDENSYKLFEKHFSDVININKIDDTLIEKNTNSQKASETSQKTTETSEKVTETSQEKIWLYNNVRNRLWNHNNLKGICTELDKIEDFDKKIDLLTKNQKQIFDVLFKAGKETWNYDDFENIAHTFYDLWVINQTRLDELLWMVPKNMNKSLPQNWWNSIVSDYEKKWEELVKKWDSANFTIKDWKMTCESKTGMTLSDYNSADEEIKAYMEKSKMQKELNDLKLDLSDKKNIWEILLMIKLMIQQRNNDLDDASLDNIINEIWDKVPNLKDWVNSIKLSNYKTEEKIKLITTLLYAYLNWTTDTNEIRWKDINDMLGISEYKLKEVQDKVNKQIEDKEKDIWEIDKKYPDLDKKNLDNRIRSAENNMDDTIKFCDNYWLSALGQITSIKDFTKIINEKEVYNPIAMDFWKWEDYKKWKEKFCKYMAKLLGKKEEELFKEDKSWLLEFDLSNNKTITKDYLKTLLEKQRVLVNWAIKIERIKELVWWDEANIELDKQLNE